MDMPGFYLVCSLNQGTAQVRTVGGRHIHMVRLHLVVIQGPGEPSGPVAEIMGDYQAAQLYVRIAAAHTVGGQDLFHPKFLKGPDISPVIDARNNDFVFFPMSGKEIHLPPLNRALENLRRTSISVIVDKHPGMFQKFIEAASSDNSNWFHLHFSFACLIFGTEIVFSSCKKNVAFAMTTFFILSCFILPFPIKRINCRRIRGTVSVIHVSRTHLPLLPVRQASSHRGVFARPKQQMPYTGAFTPGGLVS